MKASHCPLVGVETVNAPADHMASRKLLALDRAVTLEEMQAGDFDLRALLARAAPKDG